MEKAVSDPPIITGNPATTPEIDYTDAETEFMTAMEQYRSENSRRFPTSREVLAVLISLGYRRVAERGPLPCHRSGDKTHEALGRDADVPQATPVTRLLHAPGTASKSYHG